MKKTIETPIDKLTPISIPGNFTFSIMFTVEDVRFNNFSFVVQVVDPAQGVLLQTENINVPPSSDDNAFVFEMQIRNLVLMIEGDYSIIINSNVGELAELKVPAHPVLPNITAEG